MEQSDYLQRQIEQVGKVLAKLFSDLLKLQSSSSVAIGIEQVNEKLTAELNLDIEKLINLKEDELNAYLSGLHLTADHLDLMSGFLEEIARTRSKDDPEEALRLLQKAVLLSEIADKVSNTTSFDRLNRNERIKNRVQEIEGKG